MSEYLLEVRNVNKSFGGVVTANDVCMSVEPGQIRGLIGPNGAGKTTLLNLISGIYDVDGGNISLTARMLPSFDACAREDGHWPYLPVAALHEPCEHRR